MIFCYIDIDTINLYNAIRRIPMQWFKHDTDATQDAKLKKLLIRHGATGYAIYFHCLELIASDISNSNLTFELEHDSEIIADNLKIRGTAEKSGIDIVEEIMRYIIDLDLFSESDGHIFCFKLLKRLDTSMTSNDRFRDMISDAKDKNHDSVMTQSCKKRREEKREEENRIDKIKINAITLGDLQNVTLSHVEYDKLKSLYLDVYINDYVSRLSLWKPNASRKVKSDLATLMAWMRRDNVPKIVPKQLCPHCGKPMTDGDCLNPECPQWTIDKP